MKAIDAETTFGRFGDASEIAAVVAFLASAKAGGHPTSDRSEWRLPTPVAGNPATRTDPALTSMKHRVRTTHPSERLWKQPAAAC